MRHDSIEIRPFRVSDQAAVKSLILAGLEEHWGTLDPNLNPDLDDIARHYAHSVFLTAWQADALVGTGALIPKAPGVSRIVRMSVDRGCRCGGIGRRILNTLLDHARSQGYRRIVLETTDTWDDAITFYLRCGFHITGRHDGNAHFALDM